jgi:hypothetical protein
VSHFISVTTNQFFRANFKVDASSYSRQKRLPPVQQTLVYSLNFYPPSLVVLNLTPFVFLFPSALLPLSYRKA